MEAGTRVRTVCGACFGLLTAEIGPGVLAWFAAAMRGIPAPGNCRRFQGLTLREIT